MHSATGASGCSVCLRNMGPTLIEQGTRVGLSTSVDHVGHAEFVQNLGPKSPKPQPSWHYDVLQPLQ